MVTCNLLEELLFEGDRRARGRQAFHFSLAVGVGNKYPSSYRPINITSSLIDDGGITRRIHSSMTEYLAGQYHIVGGSALS
jgi:hypothetical protein